jgi:hypothetical protein
MPIIELRWRPRAMINHRLLVHSKWCKTGKNSSEPRPRGADQSPICCDMTAVAMTLQQFRFSCDDRHQSPIQKNRVSRVQHVELLRQDGRCSRRACISRSQSTWTRLRLCADVAWHNHGRAHSQFCDLTMFTSSQADFSVAAHAIVSSSWLCLKISPLCAEKIHKNMVF